MASDRYELHLSGAGLSELIPLEWRDEIAVAVEEPADVGRLVCAASTLPKVCELLTEKAGYAFASLVVEEDPEGPWRLTYVFLGAATPSLVCVEIELDEPEAPSLSGLPRGPSVDWHEREAEDLFGLNFEGHPRLGEFILHEDWPEGVNPMRHDFPGRAAFEVREREPEWRPSTIVASAGAFSMPVGPVFSDTAEAAHFLLETVGEDVIRTIPRFFYKFRGVEKIAEGQELERALLLAERFSGSAAFAHALAFCQATETICGVEPPARARVLRSLLAELERLRSHAAGITGICNSTALAVAASHAAIIEEDLLRLSCEVGRHRYLFGLAVPGGLAGDLGEAQCRRIGAVVPSIAKRLAELFEELQLSSTFLDRLEQVGIVTTEAARTYGLVGPIARASGIATDLRKVRPYAAYGDLPFETALESEGDGYARLRVLFYEAEQSAKIILHALAILPEGPVATSCPVRPGAALGAVEAPSGAAFHWLRIGENGRIGRLRITPPSFANWHGFQLAAENFAFQDFPIILASFALSNAECDR